MTDNLLENLNPQQREAVEINDGSLLVFAGAGSGKTRVITTKIAYAISRGLFRPEEILAVTFTNKACDEMRQRVDALVGPLSEKVMIKTFHSFGAWFLRTFTLESGLEPGFGIFDEDDCKAFLCQCFPDEPKKYVAPIASVIAGLKDRMEKPDARTAKYAAAYKTGMRAMNKVDFADLIIRPIRTLKTNKAVSDYIHSRFRMILVDEYQDSNKAQSILLKLLAGPGCFVCAVGDDDQSIYRFRGADVGNILEFPDVFPNCRKVVLGTNYRCGGAILAAAKDVISNNTIRAPKDLNAAKNTGNIPKLYHFPSDRDEADFVVSKIVETGDYPGTAVIYRNNSLSRLIEDRLMRAKVPYHIVGSTKFYEREEVKDCMALLNLVRNHKDKVSFKRMVNKPARGLGGTTVEKILEASEKTGSDVFAASEKLIAEGAVKGEKATKLSAFLSVLGKKERSYDNLILFREIVEDTGLLDMYKASDDRENTDRCGNISQLAGAIAEEEYRYGPEDLDRFLEDAALIRNETKDRGTGVTLITMHSTKGLEFSNVFVIGMDDLIIPGSALRIDRDDFDSEEDYEAALLMAIEEERRLCYVAFTRAKDNLYISTVGMRSHWGAPVLCNPSMFLSEIAEDHIRHVFRRGGWDE